MNVAAISQSGCKAAMSVCSTIVAAVGANRFCDIGIL
jgi:hypothetical protein